MSYWIVFRVELIIVKIFDRRKFEWVASQNAAVQCAPVNRKVQGGNIIITVGFSIRAEPAQK